MTIYIDTNVIVACPFLNNGEWMLISQYVKNSHATLVVSEVVIKEAKRNYHTRLKTSIDKIPRDLAKLVPRLRSHLEIRHDHECNNYARYLDSYLEGVSAEIALPSNVRVENLVERCFADKRPFNGDQGKKGFCDSVIWESLVASHEP